MAIFFTQFIYLTLLLSFISFSCSDATEPVILAIISDDESATTSPHGAVRIKRMEATRVRLVGTNLTNAQKVMFTPSENDCVGVKSTESFNVGGWDERKSSAYSEITIDYGESLDSLYICLNFGGQNNNASSQGVWKHQGSYPWRSVELQESESGSLLPLWLQISIIAVLLVLSGMFSGLNLGLMSLDQTELAIIQKVGSPSEKKHAKRISPLRKKGNFLLCTLLLGNVMVNSTFTILFDDLTNGLIAIVSSTFGIVVFGEIIPQAICSRHGLAVGARTYWLTRFFMVVTFPLSFPISLILDRILGEEMGQVFNKEKLQELVRMTADKRVLNDDEANIISGALQLTNKNVEEVMTKIEDVYMLDINTELDFETLAEIMRHGYTRIPVYDGEKTNIVNLLNIKDLALIDPDDKTLLSTVCRFYDRRPLLVDVDFKLGTMLQMFLQGNSHMAIVQRLHNQDVKKDPYFENTGVVTLEDVIEEILQSEIIDETDRMTDNRLKKPLTQQKDYATLFPSDPIKSKLPRQLEFVAFQFLSSNVEAFSEDNLNRNVLKNLMKKNIVVNLSPTTPVTSKNYIFQKGVPSDKFVLILQGTVEVTIGSENMVFESGPFSTFGSECINSMKRLSTPDLKGRDYIPDFSVRALTPVQYLCIQRSHYMAAIRTTKMLRSHVFSPDDSKVNDHFDMEYAKLSRSDKNMSSNKIIDIHASFRRGANSFKGPKSPVKGSTSSLNRLPSSMNKEEVSSGKSRIRRSGSDAKCTTVDLDSDLDMMSNNQSRESMSGEMTENKNDLLSAENKPLLTQTSLPFIPHIDQRGDDIVLEEATSGPNLQPVTLVDIEPDLTEPSTDSKSNNLSTSAEPRDTFPDAVNDQSGFGINIETMETMM